MRDSRTDQNKALFLPDQRTGTDRNNDKPLGFLRLDVHINDLLLITNQNGEEVVIYIKERQGNRLKYAIRAPKSIRIQSIKGY
jgi:hypothetical protein